MMKKGFRFGLALTMAATMALTAACGGNKATSDPKGGDSPKEKVTLRMLTPIYRGEAGNQLLKDLMEEFKQKNPDLNVDFDIEFLPDYGRLNEKLTTYAAGNMLPDVYMIGVGWIEPFAGKKLIEPLDGKLKPATLAEYDANIIESGYYKGKLYGLPLVLDTRFVVYRKDMLDAAGLKHPGETITRAELVNYAKQLTKRDASGKLQVAGFDPGSTKNRQHFYQVLWAGGGSLFNADSSKATFNDAKGVEAVQWWADLWNIHKVVDIGFTTGVPGTSLMTKDMAAMAIAHNMYWAEVEKQRPDLLDKIGVTILKDESIGQFYGGTMAVVSSQSKHKDVAFRVVEYLASPEVVLKNVKAESTVPPLNSLKNDPYVTGNLLVSKAMEHFKYAKREGGPEAWLEIRGKLDSALEEAVQGKRSIKEILDGLATESNDMISKSR